MVQRLCTNGPLPVEVAQFAWQTQAQWLRAILNCQVSRRDHEHQPYVTDNHNYILDCHFEHGLHDPERVKVHLADRPGIVGHGLFMEMASDVIAATQNGLRHFRKHEGT